MEAQNTVLALQDMVEQHNETQPGLGGSSVSLFQCASDWSFVAC
ncbi:SapB/AmfS family lanthipeptide [Streptomyces lonarensis]|uniref:SapB/AmfS family lantipeptide n=1 Tax=Streptomyces lonarensis TaxID=700599 RepID=A0A7X6CY10_9ACTN|nr:SapB/AmfS family lanthipeptide [Streptomyces lonarensis]NJQ04489.1 SapB/AmfS family lantipeptide [Streptomyces lonarensis]